MELALAPDRQLWTTLAFAAVALGCALRLLRWIDNPGLWLDEADLSINLIGKSLGDLFGPLQFLQSAPPAFLLFEKGAETLLGDSERSLRLFPLLASLASVILFAYIARRVLARPAAALAAVLFATLEPLLLRGAEVKHYSTDVAVTTVLLALYLWAQEAPTEHRVRRLVILGAAGSTAVWFSYPAVFTLAAIVAALLVRAWEARSRQSFVVVLLTAGLALASFGVVYAIASSNVSRISASIFGGDDTTLSVGRVKTIENAWWMFIDPGGFDNETNSIAALLAGFGIVAFALARRLDRLALFASPFVLAVAADVLGRYPIGGRFSFFLVPLMILLVARGAQALVAWSRQPLIVGAGLGIFLVASPLAIAAYHVLETPARADVTPVLRHIVRNWRDGDALYVYPDSQYQLRYYAECEDCSISGKNFPWPTRIAPPSSPGEQYAPALESVPPAIVVGSRDDPDGPLGDLERLPPTGRVWLLFSTDARKHAGLDEERLLISELESNGRLVEETRARGARAYLVQRSR